MYKKPKRKKGNLQGKNEIRNMEADTRKFELKDENMCEELSYPNAQGFTLEYRERKKKARWDSDVITWMKGAYVVV